MKKDISKTISDKFESRYIINLSESYKDGGLILIAYPHWKAYVSAEESDFWIRIFPKFDLNKGGIVLVKPLPNKEKFPHPRESIFEQEKTIFLKCDKFIDLIPSKIKSLTKLYKESHWDVIEKLILLGNDLESLILSNPAMAYLIVNLDKINPSVQFSDQVELLRRLIKTKQVEILDLAKLPATESIRKIFLKINMENINENQFVRFCRTFPKEGEKLQILTKLLSHLEVINSNIIHLVNYDWELLFGLNRNIIAELSNSENNSESIKLLKKIHTRCKSVNLPFPKIKLLDELPQIDRDNQERVKKKKVLLERFPKPPLKGNDTIMPLLNAREQESWSKKQSNCIRNFSAKVRGGKSFFYKILFNGEPATLEINILKDKLLFGNLLGQNNKKVSAQLKTYVKKWFTKETFVKN